MSLFVANISPNTTIEDLEDIFYKYGKISRCDIKKGYAFIEYVDKHDAEDAMQECNGKNIHGNAVVIEWARGGRSLRTTEMSVCHRCDKGGHSAAECRESIRTRDVDREYDRHRDYHAQRSRSRHRSRSPRYYDRKWHRDNRSHSRSYSRSRSREAYSSRSHKRHDDRDHFHHERHYRHEHHSPSPMRHRRGRSPSSRPRYQRSTPTPGIDAIPSTKAMQEPAYEPPAPWPPSDYPMNT